MFDSKPEDYETHWDDDLNNGAWLGATILAAVFLIGFGLGLFIGGIL